MVCVICSKDSGKNKTCSKECLRVNLSRKTRERMSNPANRESLSDAIKVKYKTDNTYKQKVLSSIKKRQTNLSVEERQKMVNNRLKTIHAKDSTYIQNMSTMAKKRYQEEPGLRVLLSNKAKNRTLEHRQKLSTAAKIASTKRDTTAGFRKFKINNPNHGSEWQLNMLLSEWHDIINCIKTKVENNEGTVSSIAISMGLSQKTVCRYFHKLGYGHLVGKNLNKNQAHLLKMIEEYGISTRLNDRTAISPKELDLYIQSCNLGIEINGLYWHSSANPQVQRNAHRNKHKLCTNSGIKLLAFYDDEFKNKMNIVRSIVLNKLHVSSDVKLHARKLMIKNTPKEEAKSFFEANHLDGYVPCKAVFGLYSDNELIFAISTRTYVGSKYDNAIEIARLATKIGYSVRGGASKLMTHVQKEYKTTIVSYSNNRLSSGDVYKKLGFIEDTATNLPSYWYTDLKTRIFRTQCMRSNDANILTLYPTEELQALNGIFSKKLFGDDRPLYRIEDYGHRRWILKI